MSIPKVLPLGCLFVCGVMTAATPLFGADDPEPAPPDPAVPVEERRVTKIYDVRALLSSPDHFGLETSPHGDAFTNPGNRPFGNGYDGGIAGGGDRDKAGPTTAELLQQIIGALIMTCVEPESWIDNGGRQGVIRTVHEMFIVTQTPTNHKEIAALLNQMIEFHTQPVRVTADWLLLPPADVEKLLKNSPGDEHRELCEIDPAALKHLAPSVPHFRAELLGRNGQTIHFISGREKTVTFNQVAVVGTDVSAFTPALGNIADGIALQLTPNMDREHRTAVVTVFNTFNDQQKTGPPIALNSTATTQAVSGERVMSNVASATYRELDAVVQEFRTTVRMPLGTAVIAGAMTLEPSAKNAEALELLLILKVQSAE